MSECVKRASELLAPIHSALSVRSTDNIDKSHTVRPAAAVAPSGRGNDDDDDKDGNNDELS